MRWGGVGVNTDDDQMEIKEINLALTLHKKYPLFVNIFNKSGFTFERTISH